jgi:nitrogen-specific signal transduction histidine kinase
VGIEKEQQKYLFIPFLELKVKQDMKNVKNNSIGMGLSCSKMIMKQLKGKLELVESQRGRTVFKLQMPVEK